MVEFTLNGLVVGQKYSMFQIETALGMPDEKHIRMDEQGMSYQLFYGENIVHLNSETGITLFILRDNRFLVNNHLRIGNSLSVLLDTPNCRFMFEESGECRLYMDSSTIPLRINITDNIITWIGFILF